MEPLATFRAQRGKRVHKDGQEEEKNQEWGVMKISESTSTPFNTMHSVFLHKLLERACSHCLHFLTFHSFLNTLDPGFCLTMPQSSLSLRSPVTFLMAKSSRQVLLPYPLSTSPSPLLSIPLPLPQFRPRSVSSTLTYCNNLVPCLFTSRPVLFKCIKLLLIYLKCRAASILH